MIQALLGDIEYLTGSSAEEILASLDDFDNFELIYTLAELKKLVLAKLMTRDLPIDLRGRFLLSQEEAAERQYAWVISRSVEPTIGSSPNVS